MKKHFLLPLFLIMVLSSGIQLKAQIWSDIYGGTSKGTVFSVYADGVDDNLYVGGNYDTLGPNFYPSRGFGYWSGNQWVDLTEGGFGNDITKAMGRYNGEIYHSVDIGAVFYGAQTGDHRIAKFSCTNPNCHGNTAYAFQEFQGELYVGGTFDSFEDTPEDLLNSLIKWNGVSWSKVSGGVKGINQVNGTGVHAMFVYKHKLYVGGTFDTAGSIAANNLAVWDGTSWSSVGTGLRGAPDGKPRVNAITMYKGALIVGGIFDSAGSVAAKNVARWDGTSWSSVNSTFDDAVKALCVYQKNLYAGGDFTFNGNDSNHIAKFDGTNWSSLGGGMTGGKFVRSLTVWNRKLIVGGAFTELEDTIVVFNLASWKPTRGIPLKESPDELLQESDFSVTPDLISGSSKIHLTGPEFISQIDVVDQSGRIIHVQEFSDDDVSPDDDFNATIELQATDWAPGIYIMRLHTESGTVNKKIVVI